MTNTKKVISPLDTALADFLRGKMRRLLASYTLAFEAGWNARGSTEVEQCYEHALNALQGEANRLRALLNDARLQADELLTASGFKAGPWVDDESRKTALEDITGMRPAMASARAEEKKARSEQADLEVENYDLRSELGVAEEKLIERDALLDRLRNHLIAKDVLGEFGPELFQILNIEVPERAAQAKAVNP